MTTENRPLAIVTGASSGIGFELAKCCAENGFDLLIAANEPEIEPAAERLRAAGGSVIAIQARLRLSSSNVQDSWIRRSALTKSNPRRKWPK